MMTASAFIQFLFNQRGRNARSGGHRIGAACAGDRGFTLMEVLAAAAILAIVLIPLFRLHLQSLAMAEATGFSSRAPWLARQKLTEAIGGDGLAGGTDEGTFGEAAPGWRWQVSVEPAALAPLKESAERLYRVDVTVTSADGALAYRLRRFHLGAAQ